MPEFSCSRRAFLKIMGLAGTLATIGCGEKAGDLKLLPYITPPSDVIPGEASWFATTCRQCPAGCGMLAKNIDGRIIKVEGNPSHPINRGKLCPRGQASLHELYNPDRYTQPLKKTSEGYLPLTWTNAEQVLAKKVRSLIDQGRGDRIIFMTELVNGTLQQLIGYWLEQTGGEHVRYSPYAYEALRAGNRLAYGKDEIPMYRIDEADFLVAFGAGFLETWVSNVEYARRFADFHAPADDRKHLFAWVGPRRSMTAANADHKVMVSAGDAYLVAMAMVRHMSDNADLSHLSDANRQTVRQLAEPFAIDRVAATTGVKGEVLETLAKAFAGAKKPMALAEGLPISGSHALETAVAANILNAIHPGAGDLIDFSRISALSEAARADRMKQLTEQMKAGEIEMLLVHDANPVFTLPASWEFDKAIENVPMVVTFSSCADETSRHADLIMPTNTALESWGDYIPQTGVYDLMQPVMGTLHDTRQLGDILIATGRMVTDAESFPAANYLLVLRAAWEEIHGKTGGNVPFSTFWLKARQTGGAWEEVSRKKRAAAIPKFSFPGPEENPGKTGSFEFTAYPTIQFYDGKMANRMWIQELPDPLTQTTWGGWIEIHPDDAERLEIERGDLLEVASPYGKIRVPAIPIYTVEPGTLAMPIGQGHSFYGQFASGLPANPIDVYPPTIDEKTGGLAETGFRVAVKKTGDRFPIAHTDGNFYDLDREIAEGVDYPTYLREKAAGKKPEKVDPPLPAGYHKSEDIYNPHSHNTYRWCMVVDLDRCIGCGACVVACYAENNVAVVGRETVLANREMSWLRVQRYFKQDDPETVFFLPMLCQHCDQAPCEAVCPVFAPYHNIEGLNAQIYNRCIGTRDCSQNDPYKVRRFNWYTFTRPWPLDMQLNPDVTVRQKGVMEKCSFCVQRIRKAKIEAFNEGRLVNDDDFTTACAQTCPTDALVFGSLMNPKSRVSEMIKDARAYQVLHHLNTKPAVIYLKKLHRELEA